jgi:hypothetical protein
MDEKIEKHGRLFISHEVLQQEKWMVDQVISAAMLELRKYTGYTGYLKSATKRTGDFSLVISNDKLEPALVDFIGIPSKGRAAIVQELFVYEQP